jgi:hypothetical protein
MKSPPEKVGAEMRADAFDPEQSTISAHIVTPDGGKAQEFHDGLPVLDAVVLKLNRDFPNEADARTVPCDFCGRLHWHGVRADIAVGSYLHRAEHCVDVTRRGRPVVRPRNGYYLRIICNPFAPGASTV